MLAYSQGESTLHSRVPLHKLEVMILVRMPMRAQGLKLLRMTVRDLVVPSQTCLLTGPHAAYPTPRSRYQELVKEGTLRRDDYQNKIVDKLQALHEQLENYEQAPIQETKPSGSLVRPPLVCLHSIAYNQMIIQLSRKFITEVTSLSC